MKLYSPNRAERILRSLDSDIEGICRMVHLPSAVLKAVLYKEITDIDFFDPLADAIVAFNWQRVHLLNHLPDLEGSQNKSSFFRKFDSSTGYGQIFARTAILAIRFATTHGIITTETLGLGKGQTFSPDSPADVFEIWKKLHRERSFNLACSALNLLFAAWEMNGRITFENFSPDELKRTFTRYNANVRQITPYGEVTYQYYLKYK